MPEIEFKLPKMGESITEGTIISWLVNEGDVFEEGDILCEIATDKVDNEVPAPVSGLLVKQYFNAQEVVAVGETIALIQEDKVLKAVKKNNAPKQNSNINVSQKSSKSQYSIPNNTKDFTVNPSVFISPLIKQMARTHHISFEELSRIPATGHNNRLKKSDVTSYINAGRPYKYVQHEVKNTGFSVPNLKFDKGTGRRIDMDRMRQHIANHMVFSKHTSPHVTAYVEADLTEMVQWRENTKNTFLKTYNEKLTFTPLFVSCVARALKAYPMINSSLDGNTIIVKDNINIGMATALPSGNLIVPVVKAANRLSLNDLAKTTNNLAKKARENKLDANDISGSTFTISNVGTFGSIMGTPIINQPEAAILATGLIKKRAEVMERETGDTIEIRHMMYLSLSFDHRIVDGFLAGSFLKQIADNMEGFHNYINE